MSSNQGCMKRSLAIFIMIALNSPYPIYSDDYRDTDFVSDTLTLDFIRKEGYLGEDHKVVTEDGYVLTIHRIRGTANAFTIFLQHGVVTSSFDWVSTGKQKGLAFILADHGYDVWLGNARGNVYSRSHISYKPSEPRFWNFSWHEMGIYDLPAVINYITNLKNDNITFVGYSMGVTMFYIMAVERPDVASKIKAMFSLAPAAFMSRLNKSISGPICAIMNQVEALMERLNIFEFLPERNVIKFLTENSCGINLSESNPCVQLMFSFSGYDPVQFNYSLIPTLASHYPAGTSTKTFYHYCQIINTGRFKYFDYGNIENLKVYNSSEPPDYDLSKMQVPIGIFWSDNDYFVNPRDVKRLYDEIPRKILSYRIPYPKFSHLDFIWAIDAPKLLYSKLLSVIEDYR